MERRFKALQPVAREINWELTDDVLTIQSALAEILPLLGSGFHFSRIVSLMRGRVGDVDVNLFDFSIVKRGHRTAIYIRSEELKLPPFILRCNPGWTKLNLGTNFPRGGMGVVTYSEFYKNYNIAVHGSSNDFFIDPKDKELVRAFLTPALQSFYEECNLRVTIGQGKDLIYSHDDRLEPQHIAQFLKDALKGFELFKTASRISPIPEQKLNEWLKTVGGKRVLRRVRVCAASLAIWVPFITATAVFLTHAYGDQLLRGLLTASVIWLITQTIAVIVYRGYMKQKLKTG